MKIFIIQAYTGEYEDYQERNLVAFSSQEEAESFVAELEEDYSDWENKRNDEEWLNSRKYDLYVDYNGIWFGINVIELESEKITNLLKEHYPEDFL